MKSRSSSKEIILICNGFQYNITGAIFENLILNFASNKVAITLIQTPLTKFDSREIRIKKIRFSSIEEYRIPIPVAPPLSFLLDLAIAFCALRASIVISFSPHFGYVSLLLKKLRPSLRVIQWSIDFSPRRFRNTILQSLYEFVDCRTFLTSDFHVDVSEPALEARIQRYLGSVLNENETRKRKIVVRVGIPEGYLGKLGSENFHLKRVFFLGNLNPTVGIDTFVHVAKEVLSYIPNSSFHVIGSGSELINSIHLAESLGISERFNWYGNLEKTEFELLLKTASVGLAPYKSGMNSFSQFADPSKLKNYMQFAIPFVVTDIPLVVQELKVKQIGTVTADSILEIARETIKLLQVQDYWVKQRDNIYEFAKTQTWEKQLETFNIIIRNFLMP